jgi:DNA-3-methyladenine glycosylase II
MQWLYAEGVSTVKSMIKTIETIAGLEAGIAGLVERAPVFEAIVAVTGTPPLRRDAPGFASLIKIITGQLVSRASADAIWQRMEVQLSPLGPEHFHTLSEEKYRAAGLSSPKIRAIQALTRAVISGELDFNNLATLPDVEVIDALIAIKGIGPWTADIYLLACLGRRNVWPAGDLALRVGVADIFNHSSRPDIAAMNTIAAPWQPWRAVAARLIWAWYARKETAPQNL